MVLNAFTVTAGAATFLYSGVLDSYLVPGNGWYAFTVAGAQGGRGDIGPTVGGGGAVISGDLYFTSGTDLSVLVGGKGSTNPDIGNGDAGSGGGMSFIAIGSTPIIVAGGGGGSNWFAGFGGLGQIGTSGKSTAGGAGGTNGSGGQGSAAGAGWLSPGNGGAGPTETEGGGGLNGPTFAGGAGYLGGPPDLNGFIAISGPGANGGFGGGGGGGYSCGGGGGGYSGGGGGCQGNISGGGGGSYISPWAINVVAMAGANVGPIGDGGCFGFLCPVSLGINDGYVDINFVSDVPEPATWAMMLVGFGVIGSAMRRRRQAFTGCGVPG